MTTKTNLQQKVTDHIIKAMEDAKDFEMPWHIATGLPVNAVTDKAYQGINTVSLWTTSRQQGYASSIWATYKQWQSLGAQVQKGERGSTIIIYKPLIGEQENNDSTSSQEGQDQPRVLIGSLAVFNLDQVIGYKPKVHTDLPLLYDLTKQLEHVDLFINNTKAKIASGGTRAYYSSSKDRIQIPDRQLFKATSTSSPTEAYYSTLLHELTHWSGAEKRYNRDLSGRFGGESYAMEELIAELGAAFLCAELKISTTPRQDHADYLANWIEVLKQDEKAIFFASARAAEACAYLNLIQEEK